jgi:hypothetical protein
MTYTFKLSRRLAVVFLSLVLALVLVAFGFLLGSSSDTTSYLNGERLAALLPGIATRLFYLVIVGIGCAAGRMFPFQHDFQGSREFLEHMFPGRSVLFYARMDFLVTCVMGARLGTLIMQPTSVHSALATGLGWPFIIRFLLEGMKTVGRPVRR